MKKIKYLLSLVFTVFVFAIAFTLTGYAEEITDNYITYKSYGNISNQTCEAYVISSDKAYISGDIVIPSSVKIGENTFYVKKISKNGFSSCEYITSVTIPDSVISLGTCSFLNCPNLKTVVFEGSICSLSAQSFMSCSALTSVTLPSALEKIPKYCFKDCSSLNSIDFPETLKEICEAAFQNCKLEYVNIPASLETIDSLCFSANTSLKSITVSEDNAYFKDVNGVLYSKDGSVLIQYPTGGYNVYCQILTSVESIESQAFAFSNIQTVRFPANLKEIGEDSFKECKNLSSVEFNDKLEIIGNAAFYKCTALKTITIPCSVTSFEQAFRNSGLESAVIESGVTEISSHAFQDCKSLRSVTLPETIGSIKNSAFSGCTNLESLIIPTGVDEIGTNAFLDCNIDNFTFSGGYPLEWAVENGYVEVEKIKVTALPSKTSYNYKDNLNSDGLVVTVYYSNGVSQPLDSSEYKLENTYFSKTGTNTVKVVYGEYSTSFDVSVSYSFIQMIIMILLLGFLWY